MNPFGSAIYIIGAAFLVAMALIGYGVYSEIGWVMLLGAIIGLGVIVLVLYGISHARFS